MILTSTYEELLTKSKLPTLKIRRIRTISIETFKIVNKTSPLYLHDLITIKQSKYSFRYQNTASIPSTRTTRYGIKTFKYFAAKTWNELPNHFRLENSFKQFKNLINSWNGSSCHCNALKHNFIYLFVLLICDAFEICALSLIIVTF